MNSETQYGKYLTLTLFSLGLFLRIIMIPMYDSKDVGTWVTMGKETYEKGLSRSFKGAYFPVQYLIFTSAYVISDHYSLITDKLIKVYNLFFEICLFALLILLTKGYASILRLVTLYWLNPFSLILFEQGYADAQGVFFVFLALFIIARQWSRYPYILASVPLGIAFLMKPHATPILLGIALFVAMLLFKRRYRDLRIAGLFVFPIILFLSFSVYLGLNLEMKGHKTLPKISSVLQDNLGLPPAFSDLAAKSTYLGAQYLYIPKIMAAINAYMPNPWYFVAESMRTEGMPIYRVHDTKTFLAVTYRNWGLFLFLSVFIFLSWKQMRRNDRLETKLVRMMLVAPILVPYLTTNAHENHFYYGFVSLITLGILLKDDILQIGGYLLGTLNGINLLLLFIVPHYFPAWQFGQVIAAKVSLAAASSLVFIIVLGHLLIGFRNSLPIIASFNYLKNLLLAQPRV